MRTQNVTPLVLERKEAASSAIATAAFTQRVTSSGITSEAVKGDRLVPGR